MHVSDYKANLVLSYFTKTQDSVVNPQKSINKEYTTIPQNDHSYRE